MSAGVISSRSEKEGGGREGERQCEREGRGGEREGGRKEGREGEGKSVRKGRGEERQRGRKGWMEEGESFEEEKRCQFQVIVLFPFLSPV